MVETIPDDRRVLVCDQCNTASCWYGEFMCDRSRGAGLKIMTVAQLRNLKCEHEENWSREKMESVYGIWPVEFTTEKGVIDATAQESHP